VATFRQMQDAVLEACGLGSSSRTRVKAAINEAYYLANAEARLYHADADVTTTSGQSVYSLRTDFLIEDLVLLRTIVATSSDVTERLVQIVDPVMVERLLETSNVGQGTQYVAALAGVDRFLFWPAIEATLTIRYVARPDELVSDDSEPWIVPKEHHDVLVLGACLRVGRRESQAMAQGFRAEHQAAMRRLHKWKSDLQGSGPKRIRVRGASAIRSREDYYFPGDEA
jgi:hypothetical protein